MKRAPSYFDAGLGDDDIPQSVWQKSNLIAFGVAFLFVLLLAFGYKYSFFKVSGLRNTGTRDEAARAASPQNLARQFPELLQTRKAGNAAIMRELAEIISDGGTAAIVKQRSAPPELNVADQFTIKMGDASEQNAEELRNLFDNLPFSEDWHIPNAIIQRAKPLLEERAASRIAIKELLANEGETAFEPLYVDSMDDGSHPSPALFDSFDEFVFLEELEAARAFQNNNVSSAVDSVVTLLRLAKVTSQAKHISLRIMSANTRKKALEILETIIWHTQFTQEHAEKIHDILSQQLATWPSDAGALIGDRLTGMRLYEQARKGLFFESLSDDEKKDIEALQNSVALYRNLKKTIDADQIFYFRTMRSLISVSEKPFFQRANVIDEIDKTLTLKKGLPDYPLIASVLLNGLTTGMRQLAADRMRTEMWTFALAHKLKRPFDNKSVDPLTGNAYIVETGPSLRKPGRRAVSASALNGAVRIEIPE